MKTLKTVTVVLGVILLLYMLAYGQPGQLTLNPSELDFTAVEGESLPVSLGFTLTISAGSGIYNWSVSDDALWMEQSPTSGSSLNQLITVSTNTTSLVPGHHLDTISVSCGDCPNSPQFVTVDYEIVASQCYGDANCSGDISAADIIYLVQYVFKGGAAPGCP